MTQTGVRGARGLLPLMLVGVVVVLVAIGFSRVLLTSNLHNGMLALSFTFVGAYVLYQRPGHREGLLFMAAGLVEAVMFFGRQIGHTPTSGTSPWWGWLGVTLVPVALALCTFAVICFPDGRLPSRRWRGVAIVVVTLTMVCTVLSALWPLEHDAAGVLTQHPINTTSPEAVESLWTAIAYPSYIGFQLLWVVAIVARWRSADLRSRRQLTWVFAAALVSVAALVLGLAIGGTPRPGLLSAALLPIAAGLAIVHGQQVAAYSALTWLSRTGPESEDLPMDVARAVGEALGAEGATLWMGSGRQFHAVGLWPESREDIPPVDLDELAASPERQVRSVRDHGKVVGALSIDRAQENRLTRAEERLFDDLAAQAVLVLKHLTIADLIERERRAGHLEGLSAREREVLELMARGLSNAAICEELHLSIKTVEPIVSTIFTKLELHPDAGSNRRVLAVLAFVRT